MKQRIHRVAATLLCGLALGLTVTPSADAQPGQVLRAVPAGEPSANISIDDEQGSHLFNLISPVVQAEYAGSVWTFWNTNQLRVFNKEGREVLDWLPYYTNSQLDYFLVHVRRPTLSVDGTIRRWGEKLEKGEAELFITTSGERGSMTIWLRVPLSFSPL